MATDTPVVGGLYRHFKGMYYVVTDIAEHSETGEKHVVYRQLYPPYKAWIRPLPMFMEPVDRQKYPDCPQDMRFELMPGKERSNIKWRK